MTFGVARHGPKLGYVWKELAQKQLYQGNVLRMKFDYMFTSCIPDSVMCHFMPPK